MAEKSICSGMSDHNQPGSCPGVILNLFGIHHPQSQNGPAGLAKRRRTWAGGQADGGTANSRSDVLDGVKKRGGQQAPIKGGIVIRCTTRSGAMLLAKMRQFAWLFLYLPYQIYTRDLISGNRKSIFDVRRESKYFNLFVMLDQAIEYFINVVAPELRGDYNFEKD